MFSNLLFLILVLLVVNLASELPPEVWGLDALTAFVLGLVAYTCVLGVIALQNRLLPHHRPFSVKGLSVIANIELLLFLSCYHFFLSAHRLYASSHGEHPIHTSVSMMALAMYFGGLAFFHYTSYRRIPRFSKRPPSAWIHMTQQIRFLLPFVLPFLLFGLLFDLLPQIPIAGLQRLLDNPSSPVTEALVYGSITLVFMALVMAFLPPVIQKIWQCTPLPNTELSRQLNALCHRSNFKNAGMRIWTVMNHSLTAAIIGIVPRYRYVMFTQSLLDRLPPQQIEAILAHEIGHSHRKHLLIYPFIILGMVVVAGLFFLFVGPTLMQFFALQEFYSRGSLWRFAEPFAILVPYALIIAIYFRLVFGYFSRCFERQADLHVFEVGVPAEHLIDALDSVAVMTGNSHKQPSWHHYSIAQRITFLESCLHDPQRIVQHHRRTRRSLTTYVVMLVALLTILVSPLFPATSILGPIAEQINISSQAVDRQFNDSLRRRVASVLVKRYSLNGEKGALVEGIARSLVGPAATEIPGVVEFYGAQYLLHLDELSASATLMTICWQRFDFNDADANIIKDFDTVTTQILVALEGRSEYAIESLQLHNAREEAKASMQKQR